MVAPRHRCVGPRGGAGSEFAYADPTVLAGSSSPPGARGAAAHDGGLRPGDGGAEDVEGARRAAARRALARMVAHVRANRSRPSLRALEPSEVAVNFAQYVDGLAVGLEALSPEQRAAIADDIGDRICDPTAERTDVHLLTLLELRMPDVASSRALDCALGGVADFVSIDIAPGELSPRRPRARRAQRRGESDARTCRGRVTR